MHIDINSDMGESYGAWVMGADDQIMPNITSANIACGFHGGDPRTIDKTIKLAKQHGVAVGAHPSYPDLQGFGRRRMNMSLDEVEAIIIYQVGAMLAFARANDVPLVHVKAHGELYNWAAVEPSVAAAIARGIKRSDPSLVFVGLATAPKMLEAAEQEGVKVAREAFADRMYMPDGTLQPRSIKGSVHQEPEVAAQQVLDIVQQGKVKTADGSYIPLEAETICIHGDNPPAPRIAAAVREACAKAGIEVRRLAN
ncbi:MAG TPA: 5-oxoprolinase subunit PxpA [Chloroflexota bacterium]|nr:5-oxoprolinase subunit PxpA [Chloroflexota bacterium]